MLQYMFTKYIKCLIMNHLLQKCDLQAFPAFVKSKILQAWATGQFRLSFFTEVSTEP